ncbi:MAG: RecX family transcriptional regulator [Myxococcaceae bacterium]|jgi:regulatory protein|nr:RecX family transcriptional regulator [Myxococcaceae bacterium]
MARKVTEQRLMNVAVFHLGRYAASVAGLRRVLTRRARRWERDGAEVDGDVERLVELVVVRLRAVGLLDDERLAAARVASLRRGGASARAIDAKLRRAGLGSEVVKRATATEATTDAAAVWTWARRKKLGVFRERQREERRQRDLAALVRAGFSFREAKAVVDAKAPLDDAPP